MKQSIFWARATFVAVCVGASLYAVAESREAAEWSRFSSLFNSQRSASDVVVRLQKMESLRSSAQSSLERLLAQQPKSLDLELRLGELLVSRGRDLEQFSFEMALLNQKKEADDLRARSVSFLKQGLAWNQKVLLRGQNHPLVPVIYLSLARTHYSLGRKSEALTNAELGLQALGRRQLPDAASLSLQLWLLKADAAFDLSRAPVALQAYSQALTGTKAGSAEAAYVEYKLAWVHYNLKDPVTALSHLDKLLDLGSDRLALRQEAVRDFALFLADAPRAEFERRRGFPGIYQRLATASDETAAALALERLGHVLAKNGRRNDAIAAFEFLISELPRDSRGVGRALTIIEWSQSLADKKALTEKYFWLLKEFGRDSVWFQAQSSNPEVQRLALDSIEKALRVYAVGLHEEAARETRVELRDEREKVVASIYEAHISHFDRQLENTAPEAARVHYYRAEIHRRFKEYSSAGNRYDSYLRLMATVPETKRAKLDLKFWESALWESTSVWAEAIEKDPQWVQPMLAACDRFVRFLPQHKMAAQVDLDAARVEAKLGQLPLALSRLKRLVETYPKTPQATEAVHAQLDLLNKSADWINLAQSARRYSDTLGTWVVPSETEKQKSKLTVILSQTEARACEALRGDPNRKLEAALCFEAFARGFPKDTQAPQSLWLAADLFDQLQDFSASLSALDRLVKGYPQSTESLGAFSKLASTYEKSFSFDQAIEIYEKLKTRNLEPKEKNRILERLALLYWNLGKESALSALLSDGSTPTNLKREFEARKTEALVERFLREGEELQFGDTFWGRPDVKQGMKTVSASLVSRSLDLTTELRVRRLRGLEQRALKRLDKADEEWMAGLKEFWRSKEKSAEHWHQAATLRLDQASLWETAFASTDVMKNPTRKAELFSKLETWYGDVIKMKAPAVALEALWASARLHLQFAQDLRNAPIPEELLKPGQEQAKAEYQDLIFEKTEPLRKKSLKLIESLASKAQDWKVVSPTVLSALHVVRQMREGNAFPNELRLESNSALLRFPWSELPRWMDLSSEVFAWEQWQWSNDKLKSSLAKGARSEQRRSAFVTLAREGSLSDPRVRAWSETFTDKVGVQLRIQAFVAAKDWNKAALFLDQYASLFGRDSFLNHWMGQLSWARGDFLAAYAHWNSQNSSNFADLYWTAGWDAMFQTLTRDRPLDKSVFATLREASKSDVWAKSYLTKLCVENQIDCGTSTVADWVSNIKIVKGTPWTFESADRKGFWTMSRDALKSVVERQVDTVTQIEGLEPLRQALSQVWELRETAYGRDSDRETLALYNQLKKRVDAKQDTLDQIQKTKSLTVGAAQ